MKYLKYLVIILIIYSYRSFPQENNNEVVIGKYHTFNSKILNEERRIFISIPFGYERTTTRYPVLYILDGEANSQHASSTAAFLSGNAALIPQMIVVGINNKARNRDFTPTKTEDTPGSGGADNFLKFLEEELIPYIDKNYRTEPYRVLFGHSLTAMFSIYTLLTNPDLFSGYIAASPYVMYNNNYIVRLAETNLRDSYDRNLHLYITLGNEPDYFEGMEKLTGFLKTNAPGDLKWDYTYMVKDDHGSVPLKTIYYGLERIYEGWKLPPGLAETGTLQSVIDHYDTLSDKYGYQVKLPENILNLFGYQVMFAGRVKEAIEIFKHNVELYPESANVYDSLGEGFETDNQLEEARKNYQEAFEKGEKVNDPNLAFYKQHLENIQKKLPQ